MADFDAERREKKKKKMKKDDLEENDLEDRSFKFHPKTKYCVNMTSIHDDFIFPIRICDQITPEALIMALHSSSSGCLLICSDEFKVFWMFYFCQTLMTIAGFP